MTNEELDQIRAIVGEAISPLNARFDQVDTRLDRVDTRLDRVETKLDRVIDRADDILTGLVRLRTEAENRDAGIRREIDSLRERVEALEAKASAA